jgi:hypothetical protein
MSNRSWVVACVATRDNVKLIAGDAVATSDTRLTGTTGTRTTAVPIDKGWGRPTLSAAHPTTGHVLAMWCAWESTLSDTALLETRRAAKSGSIWVFTQQAGESLTTFAARWKQAVGWTSPAKLASVQKR